MHHSVPETPEMNGRSRTEKPAVINKVFLKPGSRPMTQNRSRQGAHIFNYRIPEFTKTKPKVNTGLRKRIDGEDEKVSGADLCRGLHVSEKLARYRRVSYL